MIAGTRLSHQIGRAFGALVISLVASDGTAAQETRTGPRTAVDIYDDACAACHGADGRGQPRAVVGFDLPVPDFTDCSFASPETAADWIAVVRDGGPGRAFDRRMPAFGKALPADEIALVVSHVRSFCADGAWPRGDLNFPRALVTEKAFPENEALLTMAVGHTPGSVSTGFIYERRIGARSQLELHVPIDVRQDASAQWQRGLGDVGVAVKHVLAHSDRAGRILSAGGEVVLPTGKESQGLGSGFTRVEPFLAFGQMLPRESFVQAHGGVEIPVSGDHAGEAFWRTAVGTTLTQGRFNRTWTPGVELVGARELESGAATEWDIVPQLQVSLSRRQHILVSGGVRVPLNARGERHAQFLAYLLWDWFDGGFLDGWK